MFAQIRRLTASSAFAGEVPKEARLFYKGDKQLMFDTHAEVFTRLTGERRILLFDYRQRDPVTDNVYVTDITDACDQMDAGETIETT